MLRADADGEHDDNKRITAEDCYCALDIEDDKVEVWPYSGGFDDEARDFAWTAQLDGHPDLA
jgi:hypothetical protein